MNNQLSLFPRESNWYCGMLVKVGIMVGRLDYFSIPEQSWYVDLPQGIQKVKIHNIKPLQ